MHSITASLTDLSAWLTVAAVIVIMVLFWTMLEDNTSTGHGDGDLDKDDEEGPQ